MITRLKPRRERPASLMDSLRPIQDRIMRYWPLWAILILVGLTIWWGSNRIPADLTRPLVWSQPESMAPARSKLLIGSFNIHGGRGPSDRFSDLPSTAAELKAHDFDLVGLYEVHGGFTGDQATALGKHLNMASLFVPSESRYWRPHFGNGLLSQVEVENVIAIPLPCTQGRKYRNAVLATVKLDGVPIQILATHIDTRLDHKRQRDFIAGLFRSLQAPAILIGDLNQEFFDEEFSQAFSGPGIIDALSGVDYTRFPDDRRIDHILVRGLNITDAGVAMDGSSDHPIVWAEVTLPDAKDGR